MSAIPPIALLQFQPLKVFGLQVPARKISVRGGMRDHEHIYPHSPGAGVELLGRDLYKIEVVPVFDAHLIPDRYRDLWPNRLRQLREKFEAGERGPIQIPTVGVIRGYCKTWEQEMDASRLLSGEEVIWNFTEDSDQLRLSTEVISISGMSASRGQVQKTLAAIPGKKNSLWDTLMQTIDSLLAIRDQFELYSSLIESKLLSILSIIQQLDDAATELSNPENWPLVEALQSVWTQARIYYEDKKQLGFTTKYYTTRKVMSSMQLAIILYDDTSKASELLQLNGFADPMEIPAGTKVKYYQIEQQAA